MKRFALFTFIFASVCISSSSYGLEILNNESLDNISAQAVTDNPAFNIPDITIPILSENQALTSYSQGNSGIHKTVIVEFIGKDKVDPLGNSYRESFNASASIKDILYQNYFPQKPDAPYHDARDFYSPDSYTYVAFEGILKGKVVIPEYFDNNPSLKTKELIVSKTRTDLPAELKGGFICSYQGHIFSQDSISGTDQKFLIYPNRQTITIGKAENADMAILVPRGSGTYTIWEPVIKNSDPKTGEVEYLVIPKGESYIQIALSQMIIQTDFNFKIRLAHGDKTWKPTDENPLPPDTGQTLGTISLSGGITRVNGGNIFVTINNPL